MSDPDDLPKVGGSFELTDNPSPDKEHDEFYKWVGICIKEWAKIESELFELCNIVLGADRTHVAIVYYRTPSLEARISLTNDLLETLWPKKPGEHDVPEWAEWKTWRQTIRALLSMRNLLAHSPVRYQLALEIQVDESGQASKLLSQKSSMEIATSAQETLRTGQTQAVGLSDDGPGTRLRLQQARPSTPSPRNPPRPHNQSGQST